ncbi:MAG: DUF4445 domain-containing protein, partial [Actinobacteria bacterium]|nr:DUF4445 domain-containing protein [Actinomycetota bacterium]
MASKKKYKAMFLPSRKSVAVNYGYNLRQAIIDCSIDIGSSCGGSGTCGRCRVKVVEGKVDFKGSSLLSREEIDEGFVLACMSKITAGCTINIPEKNKSGRAESKDIKEKIYSGIDPQVLKNIRIKPWIIKEKIKVEKPTLSASTDDFFRFKKSICDAFKVKNINIKLAILKKLPGLLRNNDWQLYITFDRLTNSVLNIQEPEEKNSGVFGVAVDIGTTTVALQLIDLLTGKMIDAESDYNPQIKYGEDIINRIIYSLKNDGLKKLQDSIIKNIDKGISAILGRMKINADNIAALMIAGNATMMHIFYGVSPKTIREEPYITVANKLPEVYARELGIISVEDAIIYSISGVASYLGGDITSGVLATGISKKKDISLFIDLGTNGELVAGNSDWLIGCSCSAGPAFEGGGVKCGTRAVDGAIEKINIDQKTYRCSYGVIGNIKPSGICGSGLIDLIGEMYLKGVIDRKGKFNRDIGNPYLKEIEGQICYVVAGAAAAGTGSDIFISEVDLNNLIRAKSAVYSGIKTLLEELDLGIKDISHIYLAGGLGKNINILNAIIIGMLPDIDVKNYTFLGNTSAAGACMCLLSRQKYAYCEKIASKITYLELSVNMKFMDRYVAGLFLPYTDLKDFPA